MLYRGRSCYLRTKKNIKVFITAKKYIFEDKSFCIYKKTIYTNMQDLIVLKKILKQVMLLKKTKSSQSLFSIAKKPIL